MDEVKWEYKQGKWKRPVDYALFLLREPKLFVEAKALGKNLADAKWAAPHILRRGIFTMS